MASPSSSGSSPPPRVRAETRTSDRPEIQRASQTEEYGDRDGGGPRARGIISRSGSERKRRLTSTGSFGSIAGSHPDMGGVSTNSLPHRSVSQVIPSSRTRSSVSAAPGSSIATAIDITSPSPPINPRPWVGRQLSPHSRNENPASHTSQPRTFPRPFMESSLPQWQADSEVSECPICTTVFSFWYRKHHCRKCGRVVCAACSPHRITIPRQFIVRPHDSADSSGDTSPTPPTFPHRVPVIVDLTNDGALPTSTINPALGGGEEVRLCNPCVPDPNPNPLGFNSMRAHAHRSTHSLSSTMLHSSNSQVDSLVIPTDWSLANLIMQNERHQDAETRQERRTVGANDRPRFLQEMTSQPRAVPSSGSSRQRAMSNRESRPLPEDSDFCPVCRRQFPPLSPEQPIEARQTHTRDCIENYLRPTPPVPSSVREGPPLPARMLPFVATEKDCLGEEGQTAECTICMEDYEVGQTLARLECLCKFHKHCIVDWFERKTECPVHKLS